MSAPKWAKPYPVLSARHADRLRALYTEALDEHDRRRLDVVTLTNQLAHDFEASATSVRSRVDRASRAFVGMTESAARLGVLQHALQYLGSRFDDEGVEITAKEAA